MIRFLLKNLRTLGLAFILALIVWIAAVSTADPNEERLYPKPIPIQILGLSSDLVITQQSADSLQATLRAPRSVWQEILDSKQPPIRAHVDASTLQDGTYTLPVQIEINTHPLRLIEAAPDTVTIQVEKLVTRTLPIHLTVYGEPAVGYEAGDPISEQTSVILTGPESKVNSVQRVQARISISGSRESVDQLISLTALDKNNQPVNGLILTPESIHVLLPITLRGGYRDVAVKVNVQGAPASGYRLTSISVYPPIVTVFSADPNLVESLPSFVETQPLDLQNLTEDIETRLTLALPDGISVVGEQTVRVVVDIEPIQGSLTLANQPVEINNLGEGLEAVLSPTTVNVILSGPLPLLDKFRPQDLRLFVDADGLEIGTHQLDVQVELPNTEISAESLLPSTVEVTIQAAAAPTSTPTPAP